MDVSPLIQAWLSDVRISALVGTRWAESPLPPGTTFPALAYSTITARTEPNVNHLDGRKRVFARVQFNPVAESLVTVAAIHTALRDVMDFTHNQVVGGKLVLSCRVDLLGPVPPDVDVGLYTRPLDFVLRYYE